MRSAPRFQILMLPLASAYTTASAIAATSRSAKCSGSTGIGAPFARQRIALFGQHAIQGNVVRLRKYRLQRTEVIADTEDNRAWLARRERAVEIAAAIA